MCSPNFISSPAIFGLLKTDLKGIQYVATIGSCDFR